MTDRELMQMALRFFDWFYSDDHSIGREDFRATQKALRDRLEQPEWVGLTDEEIDEIASMCSVNESGQINTREFARAILKEKNT
jgi:Ca2+-binding EF-hand superfamily protein